MKRRWYQVHGGPLVVLLLTLVLAALVGLLLERQPAHAGPPRQEGGEEDHSSQSCAECHLDIKAAWETGVHAIAFTRESFQQAWVENGNDPACLDCHTTGFQPHTGQYTAENVVCEACHGQNPADHPPAEFVISTEAEACSDCHTATFTEWRNSPHAFTPDMGTVGCATCHNPHGQTVRFDAVNALCLNCHETAPNTYVHLTHNEVEFEGVDVTCASCHMKAIPGLGSGQADTVMAHDLPDHTMQVVTTPCTDCHEALSATGNVPLLVDVDEALAEERDTLRLRVNDLQQELTAAESKVEALGGTDYVQLTQGLIIGFGVGITLLWVVVRRDNGDTRPRGQ